MCTRHSELGAGNPDEIPVPWNVLVEEELGSRFQIRVNATGRHEARRLACEEAKRRGYWDVSALREEAA